MQSERVADRWLKDASWAWLGDASKLDNVQKDFILDVVRGMETAVRGAKLGPYVFQITVDARAMNPRWFTGKKLDAYGQRSLLAGVGHVSVGIKPVTNPEALPTGGISGPTFIVGTVNGEPVAYPWPPSRSNPKAQTAGLIAAKWKKFWDGWEDREIAFRAQVDADAARVKPKAPAAPTPAEVAKQKETMVSSLREMLRAFVASIRGKVLAESASAFEFSVPSNPDIARVVFHDLDKDTAKIWIVSTDGKAGWMWDRKRPFDPMQKDTFLRLDLLFERGTLAQELEQQVLPNLKAQIFEVTSKKEAEARARAEAERRPPIVYTVSIPDSRGVVMNWDMKDITWQLKQLRFAGPMGNTRFVDVEFIEGENIWTCEPNSRQRLDHYVGSNYHPDEDEGEDPEGWDQDGWDEDYANPLSRAIKDALTRAKLGSLLEVVDIGEKGHVEIGLHRSMQPKKSAAARVAGRYLRG